MINQDGPIEKDYMNQVYLFSKSPIPALLHTNRESRQVMLEIGYELAFGTEHAKPLTWFNFQMDVLYLIQYPRIADGNEPVVRCEPVAPENILPWPGNIKWTPNGDVDLELTALLPRDSMRVRRLAIMAASKNYLPRPRFLRTETAEVSPDLYEMLSRFGCLQDFFIVEKHVGENLGDRREDLWGYVNCEGIDAKPRVWEHGKDLSLAYYWQLVKYADQNGGHWDGYFRDREKELEAWFAKTKRLTFVDFQRSCLDGLCQNGPIETVPKVEIVSVMPRAEANKLLSLRDEYLFKRAELRFWQEDTGMIEHESDEENNVIREQEEAEVDQWWGLS